MCSSNVSVNLFPDKAKIIGSYRTIHDYRFWERNTVTPLDALVDGEDPSHILRGSCINFVITHFAGSQFLISEDLRIYQDNVVVGCLVPTSNGKFVALLDCACIDSDSFFDELFNKDFVNILVFNFYSLLKILKIPNIETFVSILQKKGINLLDWLTPFSSTLPTANNSLLLDESSNEFIEFVKIRQLDLESFNDGTDVIGYSAAIFEYNLSDSPDSKVRYLVENISHRTTVGYEIIAPVKSFSELEQEMLKGIENLAFGSVRRFGNFWFISQGEAIDTTDFPFNVNSLDILAKNISIMSSNILFAPKRAGSVASEYYVHNGYVSFLLSTKTPLDKQKVSIKHVIGQKRLYGGWSRTRDCACLSNVIFR